MATKKKSKTKPVGLKKIKSLGFESVSVSDLFTVFGNKSKRKDYYQLDGKLYSYAQTQAIAREQVRNARATSPNIVANSISKLGSLFGINKEKATESVEQVRSTLKPPKEGKLDVANRYTIEVRDKRKKSGRRTVFVSDKSVGRFESKQILETDHRISVMYPEYDEGTIISYIEQLTEKGVFVENVSAFYIKQSREHIINYSNAYDYSEYGDDKPIGSYNFQDPRNFKIGNQFQEWQNKILRSKLVQINVNKPIALVVIKNIREDGNFRRGIKND